MNTIHNKKIVTEVPRDTLYWSYYMHTVSKYHGILLKYFHVKILYR